MKQWSSSNTIFMKCFKSLHFQYTAQHTNNTKYYSRTLLHRRPKGAYTRWLKMSLLSSKHKLNCSCPLTASSPHQARMGHPFSSRVKRMVGCVCAPTIAPSIHRQCLILFLYLALTSSSRAFKAHVISPNWISETGIIRSRLRSPVNR